jgi:hypothetical protein
VLKLRSNGTKLVFVVMPLEREWLSAHARSFRSKSETPIGSGTCLSSPTERTLSLWLLCDKHPAHQSL